METLSISTIGIIALWVAGIVAIDNYKKKAWEHKLRSYNGRVVKLSEAVRKKHKNAIGSTLYGEIVDISQTDEVKHKILEVEVLIHPSKEVYALEQKAYDEQFKQIKAKWEEDVQSYQKAIAPYSDPNTPEYHKLQNYQMRMQMQGFQSRYGNPVDYGYTNGIPEAYVPAPPQQPMYAFSSGEVELTINTKKLKLMPEGFDILTGSIIKNINSKRGGEKRKKMGKMPRIFRFAIYSALVVLVWDFVYHINEIAMFSVNLFLHK